VKLQNFKVYLFVLDYTYQNASVKQIISSAHPLLIWARLVSCDQVFILQCLKPASPAQFPSLDHSYDILQPCIITSLQHRTQAPSAFVCMLRRLRPGDAAAEHPLPSASSSAEAEQPSPHLLCYTASHASISARPCIHEGILQNQKFCIISSLFNHAIPCRRVFDALLRREGAEQMRCRDPC
jgi:hypothetical protein